MLLFHYTCKQLANQYKLAGEIHTRASLCLTRDGMGLTIRTMKWIELSVYTTDAGVEPVCDALAGVGLEQVSIEESEAAIEKHLRDVAPYWDFADAAALASERGPCVKAYIAKLPEQQALLKAAREAVLRLREFFPEEQLAPLAIEETELDEADWANGWKRYYKPLPIGERLLVCPSWEEQALSAAELGNRLLIRMDPGMAFGTGAHHTTRLCLQALERCVRAGDSVLDIGSGSGILSIAALRLGAASAVCVDIDPVSQKVVRENLRRNMLAEDACPVHIGNILQEQKLRAQVAGQYDIVVANIVADVVIGICAFVNGFVKKEGYFLCSGVIDEREQEVAAAVRQAGFEIVQRYTSKDSDADPAETEWVALLGRKG